MPFWYTIKKKFSDYLLLMNIITHISLFSLITKANLPARYIRTHVTSKIKIILVCMAMYAEYRGMISIFPGKRTQNGGHRRGDMGMGSHSLSHPRLPLFRVQFPSAEEVS